MWIERWRGTSHRVAAHPLWSEPVDGVPSLGDHERAVARDGLDADAVRKRIASQLTNEQRSARGDVVIDNSGSEEAFLSRLKEEFKRVTATT